ncbi:MAG: hypothetical protein VYC34_04725, partial [Planctomycetota bacterium]|nr:hypothetical protein [Planctomycetota bacterium]
MRIPILLAILILLPACAAPPPQLAATAELQREALTRLADAHRADAQALESLATSLLRIDRERLRLELE